jgi:hypothetical protein
LIVAQEINDKKMLCVLGTGFIFSGMGLQPPAVWFFWGIE